MFSTIPSEELEKILTVQDVVERSVVSYGGVEAGYLEKGCSWITLFIAMAPSVNITLPDNCAYSSARLSPNICTNPEIHATRQVCTV